MCLHVDQLDGNIGKQLLRRPHWPIMSDAREPTATGKNGGTSATVQMQQQRLDPRHRRRRPGTSSEQRREQWCHDVSLRLPQASAVAPSGRPAWKPA